MRSGLLVTVALAAVTLAPGASAQDVSAMVRGAGSDRVAFAFPARPGVCGAGDAILIREADGTSMFMSGDRSHGDWRGWRAGEPPCETGDVVVRAVRTGQTLTQVSVRVGGAERTQGEFLGAVDGQAAVDYLLDLAATAPGGDARTLILAAALADAPERWPGLLRLARDRSLERSTRKSALHWLGREAAAQAARELGGIVRDRTEEDEVRESAVFALSQLPDEQAVDHLIAVVRSVPDPRIRGRALFWLADFEDPRAIALFEEILTR